MALAKLPSFHIFFMTIMWGWSWCAFSTERPINLNLPTHLQFQLHRSTYILPLYHTPNATGAYNSSEFKYQFSFLIRLMAGKRHSFSFAYTQKSFWQLYDGAHSAPFRETNYNPQFFYRYNLRTIVIDLGYEHESNGEEDPMSRSWDRAYARVLLRSSFMKFSVKYWSILQEDPFGDFSIERPVSMKKFLGNTELAITWRIGHLIFKHLARYNFSTHYGYQQHMLAYPWIGNRIFWDIYYSKGYGDSLRDYNHSLESMGVGILMNP